MIMTNLQDDKCMHLVWVNSLLSDIPPLVSQRFWKATNNVNNDKVHISFRRPSVVVPKDFVRPACCLGTLRSSLI